MATTRKTAAASPVARQPVTAKKSAVRKAVSAKKETAEESAEGKPAKAPAGRNINAEEVDEKAATQPTSTRTSTSS